MNPHYNFSQALQYLLEGYKLSREGWNGSGMYAYYERGYEKFRPYFMLYTAQGDFAHWVPSTSDILAEDWVLVDNHE